VTLKGTDRYLVDGVRCRIGGQPLEILNLSVSGLFVATETPLPAGQVIELEITLPEREPFRVLGKITWVNDPISRKAPNLPRGFGIQVTRIGMADKLAILDVLKQAKAVDERRRNRPLPE
jgi:Tfp pilus assembly protein PilZ